MIVHSQALDTRSARLAAAQVLSPLFAQLGRMAVAAAPVPSAVETSSLLGSAPLPTDNTEDACQTDQPLAEPQAATAAPLVIARSIAEKRPLWRRAAIGCAPLRCNAERQVVRESMHACHAASSLHVCGRTHDREYQAHLLLHAG